MKKLLVLSSALLAVGASQAQDIVGQVVSTTPVMQKIAVPRQVCTTEQVAVPPPKTGAGAAIGAIAGGIVGHAVGGRGDRGATTVLGAVGGAVIGDRIEGSQAAQVQDMQRCSTQTVYEDRTVAYDVVYEYAGKEYRAQLPYDPGPTVELQVTPVNANPPPAPAAVAPAPPPAYVQGPPVVVMPPVYPGYYAPPYYPPIGVQFRFGYWGGYPHYGHGHRR